MFNRVILIGRTTADPNLNYTPNTGKAVTTFKLAVNRQFKQNEADFIPIVVWDKAAENCANYLKKGSLCAVDGRIQTRSYDDAKGQKKYITEIVAENVRFLDSKQKQGEDYSSFGEEVDEDVPF